MSSKAPSVKDIDDLLPQTQCQQCSFQGCLPYATALIEGSTTIDRCAPGGVRTMEALAKTLHQDPTPYYDSTKAHYQPPTLAKIREAECIGCTKCITACPVDAIIGSGKKMHTVLSDICTGCRLCVEPCPVDCIDLIPDTADPADKANLSRQRYQQREHRLTTEKSLARKQFQAAKKVAAVGDGKQDYIAAAMERSLAKRKSLKESS